MNLEERNMQRQSHPGALGSSVVVTRKESGKVDILQLNRFHSNLYFIFFSAISYEFRVNTIKAITVITKPEVKVNWFH